MTSLFSGLCPVAAYNHPPPARILTLGRICGNILVSIPCANIRSRLGEYLKKYALLLLFVALFASFAHAQQIDIAAGMSTTLSSGYSGSGQIYAPAAEKGGGFPSVSVGYLFGNLFGQKDRLGFNGEFTIRGTEGLYNGYQKYRPAFYDANLVFAPLVRPRIRAEVMGGVGAQSVIFYNKFGTCNPTYSGGCTTYISSNHFMVHAGVGVRYYAWHNFFVRPEAHLYIVPNNTQFHSDFVGRVGVSIGYATSR